MKNNLKVWERLLSTNRFKIKKSGELEKFNHKDSKPSGDIDSLRTDFHIDYDRVVFSESFRRLGRKTQVHPFAENSIIHNRLTHSIEVASVGRSLGNKVGLLLEKAKELPKDNIPTDIGILVQVASLAHDLGNPPFGHIGEDGLRDWFQESKNKKYLENLTKDQKNDIQNYEGNAHTMRIVSSLEMHGGRGGMRLTSATIGTLMKYPYTSTYESKKFNIYQTEFNYLEHVLEDLKLPRKNKNCWARHPLSYLMESADDICYALMDLEDAIEIELVTIKEVEEVLSPIIDKDKVSNKKISLISQRRRCSMYRGIAIDKAINAIVNTFIENKEAILCGDFDKKDLISVTSNDIKETLNAAKQLAVNKIFPHSSKLMSEIAVYHRLGVILDLLIPATYRCITKRKLNKKHELALLLLSDYSIDKETSLYKAYMKVLDFIGMQTDDSIAKLTKEILGM